MNGDSHIERGWKPTEFEDNIAKSAQSLLYTIVKLRRFDLNPGKTTFVIGQGHSGLSMVAGGDLSMFIQYVKSKDLKFTESGGELFLDYTTDFRDLLGQVSHFLV